MERSESNQPELPLEEDVHMAVEAALTAHRRAGLRKLHTARSRNDQVALDLWPFTHAIASRSVLVVGS